MAFVLEAFFAEMNANGTFDTQVCVISQKSE